VSDKNQSDSMTEAPVKGGASISRRRLDLIKESDVFENGNVVLSCSLVSDRAKAHRIWFELPEKHLNMTTTSMDPFLLAAIFQGMREPTDIHVHGPVSAVLLRNLAEFQSVWNCWSPQKYVPVEIFAEVVDDSCQVRKHEAVAAFSGGVDSTYTVWARTIGGARKREVELKAGLFIHGFDIPLEQNLQFDRAADIAQQTLADAGLELIRMKCNLYEPDWEMTHAAAIAACLTLLKGRFSEGLIAATFPYDKLFFPWGSNPVTDHLLSSHDFSIVHDGASVSREAKEAHLYDWQVGYNNLRVCYEAADRDKNCCRCGKCLMLYCSLMSQGLPLPASFGERMGAEALLSCTRLNEAFSRVFNLMVEKYQARGFGNEPWFRALERCAQFNDKRLMLEKPVKNEFENWLRVRRLKRLLSEGP
jgi:hypothetical protein